jgi:protein-S-isoprenylcysteine O-methyltransferase
VRKRDAGRGVLTGTAVQFYKREDHVLITSGIYRYIRHPSYFGFFYWALGTQLLLENPFSFVAYALVLWKFFSHRVRRKLTC